jgi:hypothetical protein
MNQMKATIHLKSPASPKGIVPKPGAGFVYIKMEDAVTVRRSEAMVAIDANFNGFNKIIISSENFIKLNDAIAKNKNIPDKISDSWKRLVENWK